MNRLFDLVRLIPGSARILTIGLLIFGAIGFVYYQWGLVPAIVVGLGVLLIFGLVLGYNAMIKASEKQSSKAFGKAIRNAQVGASRGEIKQAVGELGDKWQEAIGNFKNHELSLYELPWFMLVGEPQSGKSTTLKFSGLKFPIGTESISGGGGTRNCDWWFTEEGIILDTAGRFTFQESTATDAAEWNHFLSLLSKYRPYCPINGIILVIPVTSLLGDDTETREIKARNISEKLRHIQRALAIQFPVFVLLTKADTIYGFTEFFNKLTPDQQREMMGWSNEVLDSGFDLDAFDKSFRAILDRIQQIRLRNLSRPQYSYDSNKTFIFPEEFETLFEPLRHYLSVIFESSVYKANLFFRGYYVTSGMQEGQPIVRACRNIVKTGSLSENLEKIFTKSRAFFIRDFYTQKVFPEQGLVQRGHQHVRKDRLKKRIIYTLNTLLLLLGAFFVFFMHRSLTNRLERPKTVIASTLETFQSVEGDFFSSDTSRATIYENLKGLQASLAEASEASYLLFLKGKQNDLTESLQDAFAYLFLDRVLVGLFDSTVHQLSEFDLKSPRDSSEEELVIILNALKELNRWRHQVAMGDEDGFEPSIQAFLPLVMDPQWDKDLAKFRHELTLSQEFDQWFVQIYNRSSQKVQTTLIQDLARRSDGLFENLHLKVIDYYENQVELSNYMTKKEMVQGIQTHFHSMKQPHLSVEDFQGKLEQLAAFFTPQKLELFENASHSYIPFDQVRDRTIEACGKEFKSLSKPDEPTPSSDKKRQALQRDTVQFVNQLLAVDATKLSDPAADQPEELVIPPDAMAFWNDMGSPYYERYLNEEGYRVFPREGEDLQTNLIELLQLGETRANLLNSIFVTGVFNTAGNLTTPDDKTRFEQVYSDFEELQREQEISSFYRGLVRVSQLEPIRAPRPSSSSWGPLVREWDKLTDSGLDHEAFFKSLDDFAELMEEEGRTAFKAMFGRKPNPVDEVKDYKKEMTGRLKSFGQAVQNMNMISDDEIASNRKRYQGSFRDKSTLLQLTRLDEEPPLLMEIHRQSLETWSTRFVEAWQSKVGRAEICPTCPGILSEIRSALFLVKDRFPVTYQGTSSRTSTQPGETTVTISRASKENLDSLFAALDKFKNPTPQQKQYLKRKQLEPFFEEAAAWAEFVQKLQSGSVSLSFKLTATDDVDSIARRFAFADLDGAYKAKTLSLNSPAFRTIEKNPNNQFEGFSAVFHLFNDTEGNQARSYLKIAGNEFDLLGFVLDSKAVPGTQTTFDKEVPFLLNVNQEALTGTFRFKLSEPVVQPPNWETLEP